MPDASTADWIMSAQSPVLALSLICVTALAGVVVILWRALRQNQRELLEVARKYERLAATLLERSR